MRYTLLIITIAWLVTTGCTGKQASDASGTSRSDPYYATIDSLRLAKDMEIRANPGNPLTPEALMTFTGLSYFDPDSSFRVTAELIPFSQQDTFEMPTTTDRLPVYIRYGLLRFNLQGRTFDLEAYRNLELIRRPGYEDYLFVPFRDGTSGKESYGGGRYLDLRGQGAGAVLLDFNLAYNPYCAYNIRYSCPIPPVVNTLDIAVRAGEKTFSDH